MAYFYRKPNGKYLVRWYEPGGKPKSKQVPDEKSAQELKAKIESQKHTERVLKDQPGIPGWGDNAPAGAFDPAYSLEGYLATMIRGNRNLRETTREVYLRDARNHIEGTAIGRLDIRSITPEQLTEYWGGLEVGHGALANIVKLLRIAFGRAVRTSLIDVNPLDRAPDVRKPSRRNRRDVRPHTSAEIEALANATSKQRDRMEILVMAYGGLRAGETGGLRKVDVDFGRDQLHIQWQVVRLKGQLITTDVKTDAARRVVTLPRSVMAELRDFVKANPPAEEDGRLFYGRDEGRRDAGSINQSLQEAAKRVGIKTHPHALRHTAVSLWIADGASPVDVQRMVGHTDIQTTLGLYAHLFSYGGTELAESMERQRQANL